LGQLLQNLFTFGFNSANVGLVIGKYIDKIVVRWEVPNPNCILLLVVQLIPKKLL